jgi:hypothetical protein
MPLPAAELGSAAADGGGLVGDDEDEALVKNAVG